MRVDAKNGSHAYALEVDYYIDEEAKLKTDDLPLSIYNRVIKPEDVSEYTRNHAEANNFRFSNAKRLVADHSS